ncbi:MAG: hypothetical protein Q4G52_09020 [Clostridia bacterium]|nr:hypothetical protein [Clostridia bacterium]
MADDGISTKISVLGDKEYKKALQDIGRNLAVLNSEMRTSQSAFGEQETSLAGLRDKHAKLSAVYDAQREKVRLISEQLNKENAQEEKNTKAIESSRFRSLRPTL